MRQVLLAVALVAGAVALFIAGRMMLLPGAGQSLGDLAPMQAIVTDVQAIVGTGDLAKAETRITDLESAWDEAEATLRPKDPAAWGRVDDAIDAALSALRAPSPDAQAAGATLVSLQAVMANPAAGAGAGGAQMIDGIAVTDATGHPLPCEDMLTEVKSRLSTAPATVDRTKLDDLVAKATERCNADDDRNADAFSAQALAALAG
ncbi:MAG: hypothetical protein U1E58_05025 [Tabrizicola sp.]